VARPVTYDRDQVIDLAARQFWRDGFMACDVDSLTRTVGLNRHSLYKSFGGKAGLFQDALEHYLARVAAPYVALLEGGGGIDEIVAFFELAVSQAHDSDPHGLRGGDLRGCLIANTAVEMGRSDPRVMEIVDRYYERLERAFAGIVARGQTTGSVREDLDPLSTARWLLVTSQGLSVAQRMDRVDPYLPAIVRAALARPA
jgi:TetR/AcrR family transcriptional regulator, transcriptional repressor for nem operon